MALQAFMVVFSTHSQKPDNNLPTEGEVREAFQEYLNIPDDMTKVDVWAVSIEAVGYDEGQCRKCGENCSGDRLFCDDCAEEIAGLQTD